MRMVTIILAARTGWIILDIARRRPIPTPEAVQRVGAANKRFCQRGGGQKTAKN